MRAWGDRGEYKQSKKECAGAYIYRTLCIRLLDDTYGCVRDEDEKNDKGLDECAEKRTTLLGFDESENEGDKGRCE